MTNKEYYIDKILEVACDGYVIAFDNRINEITECSNLSCKYCKFGCMANANGCYCREARKKWMAEEYVESKVDWTKVAVDTPILVKNHLEEEWERRHFAKYEDGTVYAFTSGCTSWSSSYASTWGGNEVISWKYAKLYEEGGDN